MQPVLSDHFVPGSLWGLVRRGHPYDFVETYEVLREVYGYRGDYVNLGLWGEAEEPGRALVYRVADALRLGTGDRLLEVGSGLGQAAVDLLARHELAEVVGVNPNPGQRGYANALAAGLPVTHLDGDACALEVGEGFAGVLAVECAGHFSDPAAFLSGAFGALRPGGRIALCSNVARGRPGWLGRLVMQATYGFVPATGEAWEARLAAAGFTEVERVDLTSPVLGGVTNAVLASLPDARVGWSTRLVMRLQLGLAARALRAGTLGYELVSATRP